MAVHVAAQSNIKQLPAKRTSAVIKVDGNLDEPVWRETTPATGFVEWRPNFGIVEDSATKTEIYLVYDHTSI